MNFTKILGVKEDYNKTNTYLELMEEFKDQGKHPLTIVFRNLRADKRL